MDGGASGTTTVVEITSGMYLLLEHGQHPWLTGIKQLYNVHFIAIILLKCGFYAEFRSDDIGTITTDINGAGFLDGLAEEIANVVLNNMEDEIDEIIETTVKDAFQSALDELVIP